MDIFKQASILANYTTASVFSHIAGQNLNDWKTIEKNFRYANDNSRDYIFKQIQKNDKDNLEYMRIVANHINDIKNYNLTRNNLDLFTILFVDALSTKYKLGIYKKYNNNLLANLNNKFRQDMLGNLKKEILENNI
ncbi:MAG: hypothetical protein ACK5HL_03870 [Bacilli bacterium]